MGGGDRTVHLLEECRRKGNASVIQSFGNVMISIIGTGVLGLPYAFRISGWLAGIVAVVVAASLTFYCMMLLVKCREKLEQSGNLNVVTYGDLGAYTCGKLGRVGAETILVISQCGGCVAYFIFIGQNLSSLFTGTSSKYSTFIYIMIPIEIGLALFRSLSSLAPFSIFADVCNVLAMAIVIKDDFESFQGMEYVHAFRGWHNLGFAAGVSVFCFEGFGIVLSLESSMKNPEKFGKILGYGLFSVAFIYVCFGLAGYLAFGDETMDIVTLNLQNDWSSIAVKVGLCIGILLTFPVMMYPVHEMIEKKCMESNWFHQANLSFPWMKMVLFSIFRGLSVVLLAILASAVPQFGVFVSLAGSTVCSFLAFVFPSLFHFVAYREDGLLVSRVLDVALFIFGIVFAVYGTSSKL